MYRVVNEKRERKSDKKTAFSLGIFDFREVNERGWLRRGVETGNGIGNLSANYADCRKFFPHATDATGAKGFDRMNRISHKASAVATAMARHVGAASPFS